MYKPPVIVLDYETALTDGTPSVDYYRDDFRVISAAFAWRGNTGELRSLYLDTEAKVGAYLLRLKDAKIPVCVHNYQFEYGVTKARYPGCEGILALDTMRLAQVADNGGKLAHYASQALTTYDDLLDRADGLVAESSYATGLSLVAVASRWLPPEWHKHKEPFHAWIREHCNVKRGKEGSYLTQLPPIMLESYNVADAKVTLLLYETLCALFAEIKYCPDLDHRLYLSTARFIAEAKTNGVRVDTDRLRTYATEIEAEIAVIEISFRQHFAAELFAIEAEMGELWINEVKTDKVRARRREALAADPALARFNVGSTKQLAHLFVERLGIVPKFVTKAPRAKKGTVRKIAFVPKPSFKSAHMSTYGAGGELLIKRRKRLLVLKQTQALLKLAAKDGRWHCDMKVTGTATGRLAGGLA